MNSLKNIFSVIALFTVTACATSSPPVATNEYVNSVEEFSAGDIQYEGAYSNFNYRATIMSPGMQRVYVNKKTELYLWSEEKKAAELANLQANNDKATKIFLSFFTPNKWDDNMSTAKSIWTVYLHIGSQRFEGKVTKNRDSRTELISMFPYHGRFSTAYDVTFAVPVSQLTRQDLQITITGPLGVKTVKFPSTATTL